MQVPGFVRRATLRVLAAGAIAAVIVAVIGVVGARARFGADLPAARARIERDVREQFGTLGSRLEIAVERLRREPALLAAVTTRDPASTRQLFDRLAETEALANLPGVAITVYGPEARPVAWAGRPATALPLARITGADALFLAQSPMGLRLTRVAPVVDPASPERRAATVVAESPLRGEDQFVPRRDDGFVVATSIVPVPLRLGFADASGASPDAIVINGPNGDALAAVEVPIEAIDAARARWWSRIVAAEAAVLCALLLLLSGPLLDWRRLMKSAGAHAVLTAVILVLIVLVRVVAWYAVRLAGIASPPLVPPGEAGWLWTAVASPVDFLISALGGGILIALAASSFEQWRQGRRRRVRVLPTRGPVDVAAFVIAQLLAGALAGALLASYELFLRTRLVLMPYDLLHFSLHPWEPQRLAIATGLVVIHAGLLAVLVLIFRIAAAPWVVALGHRWLRAWIPVFWAAPAVAMLFAATEGWGRSTVGPAALVMAVAIAVAWRLRRLRATLEHASQAARLAAFFLALALPSLVFYPSLVDAAGRARQQLIETRYGPEVANQRRDLQRQLTAALHQIDAIRDLPGLVAAGEPPRVGPPSADAAYLVWDRTVLANQRSTSVELYNDAGSLVSRFALKLPQGGAAQTYQEESCAWALFEEVSPFFSEERILLHAGRGICAGDAARARVMAGSIAVHVTLDYSNLSFISAQSPYVALLRGPGVATEPAPRDTLEFTAYGWSRRPLYSSGRDAWPLPEDVFQKVFASREPFWARVVRGDVDYDVYFLNDRSAIYALGYPRAGAVAHLINLAELMALAALTYLCFLVGGFVYGLIADRTPTSGRAVLREVRASFYRKLFIAFVAAAVVPVLVLALVTRDYIATLMQADLEMEATRTAASASRVVEDVGSLNSIDGAATDVIDDNLVVWLSRVIAQDVNIFDGSGLLASSERNLFASGLLPTRTQGAVYRAIMLDGRSSYVGEETVGAYDYLIAAAPVRVQNREAILTVPLTLRQQEIEAQIDELDRRVLLAAVLFIMLGAIIGYSMAERIADPVNRLMKATGRIARGDLDARILATSSDEFRRLVEAFNRMAADLQRQRVELERTNRLAAWADMARQVAHDIKNPLTPIQLNAEHLRRVHEDRGEPMGHVLQECVTNILTQVRLLRSIASEFSSFASSPTVKPAPSSLHDLIDEVITSYRTGLAGRVAIDVDVPASLPMLMVDKMVLARALTNVIENALHAMPGGGNLRLSAQALSDHAVELSIADTGVGMDAAAMERLFEPYFSTRASGTGLGLTIAKRNVELNGGTIAVDSERGRGTTVRITLPTVAAAAA
ncbi:MAG TPA: HAMP domain-containing sensor histidine kinase [Vicinamibacterales bacterium]|nr:HAMP domain-containing sensor histidine kinase [Vicinamibacterales bacterium]